MKRAMPTTGNGRICSSCASRAHGWLVLRLPLGLLLALMGLAASSYAEDQPRMTVALDRSEVYEGQSVRYQITVENVEDPKQPELGVMTDFDVAFLGQQSLDSQQITIINGVMRQVVHRGREFHFSLTPKRTGQLTIPAPSLAVGGKTLQGTPERLVVLPATAQDLVAIELSADRQTIYPTQPLTVTVSVFVKQLPPAVSDRDPLSVQKTPPLLRIPWLADKDLPGGLSPQENWQQWVKAFLSHEGAGFAINELVGRTAFSFFGESDALVFCPKPTTVERRNAQGVEAKYQRYDFPRTFIGMQIGVLNLAAVTLQGNFAERVDAEGRLVGKEVYAASKPLAITVKDVPKEGRPECYAGAIGHFQVAAELTPREAKVGDPLTFTLTLRGSGSTAGAKAPELGKLPAISARFKVYEATQKHEANAVRFVYSLRPLVEGDGSFPAVPVAYFDVDKGRYETLQSEPIPLRVVRAERFSGDQIVASPRAGSQSDQELEVRREGIFANINDVAMARDEGIHPENWLIGLLSCLGAYLLIAVATVLIRQRTQDKSAMRRRAAAAGARQRIGKAARLWQAGQLREAADHLQDAFAGLVADLDDLQDAGLTPKDVVGRLHEWKVPGSLLGQVRLLLDACDSLRYGGVAPSHSLADEARQVLEALIKTVRRQKRLR